jgi:caa(3)-type oxidase subunit IV
MTVIRTYLSLLAVLAVTFGVSFLKLGLANDFLAWAFAIIKATLILYGFMHFRRELENSKIYFIVGILTLLLLVIGVMDDVLFR